MMFEITFTANNTVTKEVNTFFVKIEAESEKMAKSELMRQIDQQYQAEGLNPDEWKIEIEVNHG